MASFLAAALLGMVRQILFNSEFGAGNEASAYYAAFRLPDTLFSLISIARRSRRAVTPAPAESAAV